MRKITPVVAVQLVAPPVSDPTPALLVDAVTLLLQRQREMDAWVAQQVALARQAADRAEAREAAVAERVARIEERLARLRHSLAPAPVATTNGHYDFVRAHVSPATPRTAYAEPTPAVAVAEPVMVEEPVEDVGTPPPVRVAPSGWDLLGPTPGARCGALLMAGGAVAAVYGLLMQFGGH